MKTWCLLQLREHGAINKYDAPALGPLLRSVLSDRG